MDKYIIAYAYGEGIYNINEEDARKLTHINIAFGTLDKNGLLSREGLQHMDAVGQIRKWNPNIKIVLSVGGWGAGGFSTMAKTLNGRRAFANSCLSFIDEYKLDGLDIDWEYPGIDWAGIDASGEDKNNFTLAGAMAAKCVGYCSNRSQVFPHPIEKPTAYMRCSSTLYLLFISSRASITSSAGISM